MKTLEQNRILYHILLWWGAWSLVTFLLTNGYGAPKVFTVNTLTNLFALSIIIIVNLRYLLPQLFFKKKHLSFVLTGFLLLVFVSLFTNILTIPLLSNLFRLDAINSLPPPPKAGPAGMKWAGQSVPFIMAFLGSSLVEITRFANQKEQQANASEKEKLNTELKFLKSQVNPHFLFNALNNIYSLAVLQAPQTSESVMQLSEILRYMVYDANEEKVPLKSEINYIKNFVELQLLKDSRGMDVELDLGTPSESLRIAPLLLIPFVENAFKHSKVENLKKGYIKINLTTDLQWVTFKVVNSIPEHNFTKDEVGGVGLDNTKKRLELLYPNGKHQLTINPTDDRFEVILKISVK